jgi:hypothetical protein
MCLFHFSTFYFLLYDFFVHSAISTKVLRSLGEAGRSGEIFLNFHPAPFFIQVFLWCGGQLSTFDFLFGLAPAIHCRGPSLRGDCQAIDVAIFFYSALCKNCHFDRREKSF